MPCSNRPGGWVNVPDISRRDVLRGVSLVGAAGAGAAGGVGTHAVLSESEVFASNSIASGSLDLQVATRSTTDDGETIMMPSQETFPTEFVEESTITVAFPGIDPSGKLASGTATVAFRACDNPGRMWLRADGPTNELADAINVRASYAPECGGETDPLYDGTMTGFLDSFGAGRRLRATPKLAKVELNDEGDTFVVEAEDEGESGDTLAVDDVPGTIDVDFDGETVTVEITNVHWKDGEEEEDEKEVRGVDVASDDVVFGRVEVKGGGSPDDGVVTYRFDCTDTAEDLLAGTNPGEQLSGLSHFVMYACADDGCVGCDPACLVLDWKLTTPKKHAGESLSVDLELHATQCRHTEASNPWQ
jgi:hypothetical protein